MPCGAGVSGRKSTELAGVECGFFGVWLVDTIDNLFIVHLTRNHTLGPHSILAFLGDTRPQRIVPRASCLCRKNRFNRKPQAKWRSVPRAAWPGGFNKYLVASGTCGAPGRTSQ